MLRGYVPRSMATFWFVLFCFHMFHIVLYCFPRFSSNHSMLMVIPCIMQLMLQTAYGEAHATPSEHSWQASERRCFSIRYRWLQNIYMYIRDFLTNSCSYSMFFFLLCVVCVCVFASCVNQGNAAQQTALYWVLIITFWGSTGNLGHPRKCFKGRGKSLEIYQQLPI